MLKVFRTSVRSSVLFSLLAVLSCSRSGRQHRIAVIPRLSADAQWLALHVGVAEEAARRRVEPFWHGPSGDQAVQEQIDLLSEAVSANVRGIIVRPAAFVAESRVLNQALSKGIPVVLLSEKIKLSASPHLYSVLEDPDATGRLVAERLKETTGKGEVLILGLEPDVPGSLNRSDATESWLRVLTPDIHVVNKLLRAPRGINQDESVRQIILNHPDLHAIIALEAGEGLSAAAAISATGARDRVKIIVCGQSIDLMLLLRSGMVDSMVVQQNRLMGAKAISDIAEDEAGRHPAHDVVFEPVLVTAANLDSESVQQLLLMHRDPPW